MTDQANQRSFEVFYQDSDMVFSSSRNTSIKQPSKKLNDKMFGLFWVSEKVGSSYRLDCSSSKKIEDIFHFSLLQKAAIDPLLSQQSDSPMPIIVDDKKK